MPKSGVDMFVGAVFSFDLLKYAVSAAVIIAVTGVAGYVCLMHSDEE